MGMKNEFLVEIEFRFRDANDYGDSYKTQTIIIGQYETKREAVDAGNAALKVIANFLEVRHDDRFPEGLVGGTLVSNCCYQNPITFFAKIVPFNIIDELNEINDVILKALEAHARYKEYLKENCDDDESL